MIIEERIKELETRIKNNENALIRLDEMIIKACSPKGLPEGSSWQDYDSIRGGKKEVDLFTYVADKRRLQAFISIDKEILERLEEEKNLDIRLKDIRKNEDRVKFMKELGYKNVEIANFLGLTETHVCRLIKK